MKDYDLTASLVRAMKGSKIVEKADTSYLNDVLFKNGAFQIVDSSFYESIPPNHLRIFCVKNGLYQLPTTELVAWTKANIDNRKAIEIGSGNGVFAKALGIIATDNHLQERQDIKFLYDQLRQKTVSYGKNVKRLDAKKAIKKFKPKVVVACWVTQIYGTDSDQGSIFGVDEKWLIKKVDTYIHVGNKRSHNKRILKYPHEEYQLPWLFSRGEVHKDNIIKKKKKK